MFSFGNSSDNALDTGSRAFARRAPRSTRLRHWLAAAPLIAVAAFTFNGPAPAETSSDTSADTTIAAPQASDRWSISDVRKLISVIEESRAEGLNPTDYRIDALRMAVDADQTGPALDNMANAAALSLANDYANGRVRDKAAQDWHIAPQADQATIASGLQEALDKGKLTKWLHDLLPDNDQYRALKAAYAASDTGDMTTREQLRANMERWRWMPRKLGDRYIYVNVPSYRLELMNDGVEEASYNVVVGSPKTPTPQLALYAQSVVANPSWTLPPSVLKEGTWRNKGVQRLATKIAGGVPRPFRRPGPTQCPRPD